MQLYLGIIFKYICTHNANANDFCNALQTAYKARGAIFALFIYFGIKILRKGACWRFGSVVAHGWLSTFLQHFLYKC